MVTLSGANSTDAGGSISFYAWGQTCVPAVTLTNPDTVIAAFTGSASGRCGTPLTFPLTFADNVVHTFADTCVVNAVAANRPSVAFFSVWCKRERRDYGYSHRLQLDRSGWLHRILRMDMDSLTVSKPVDFNFRLTRLYFTACGDERWRMTDLSLTVTDNGGLQATGSCIVNVSWVNAPPVANAGPDQTVNAGAAVGLNGSVSSDSDYIITCSQWTQTAGTPVTLSNAAVANPTLTAPAGITTGTSLTFQLRVTDNGGLECQGHMYRQCHSRCACQSDAYI